MSELLSTVYCLQTLRIKLPFWTTRDLLFSFDSILPSNGQASTHYLCSTYAVFSHFCILAKISSI